MKKYFLFCLLLVISRDAISAEKGAVEQRVPGQGLTIFNSDNKALSDKEEDVSGGFVAVNNDNDDYDFYLEPTNPEDPNDTEEDAQNRTLNEIFDFNDPNGVAGENDLLHMKIEKNTDTGRSGNYVIAFDQAGSRIRIWTTATKEFGTSIKAFDPRPNAINVGVTTFPMNQEHDIWVEGVNDQKLPNGPLNLDKIALYYEPTAGHSLENPLDVVPINVYRLIGATYVPGDSSYVYRAYTSDPSKGTNLMWAQVGGSKPIEDIAGKTDRKRYSWGAGAALGYVIVSPYEGFRCKREVYIVKVEIDTNIALSKIEVFTGATQQNPNARTKIRSRNVQQTLTDTNPAMRATCRIKSITGAKAPNSTLERGVRFIQVGMIQRVTTTQWNGDYSVGVQSKKRTSSHQNKNFLDGNISAMYKSEWPWYDSQNGFSVNFVKGESDLVSIGRLIDNMSTENRYFDLGIEDTPDLPVVDKMTLDYDKTGEPKVINVTVSRFNFLLNFIVDISATTLQPISQHDSLHYPVADWSSMDRKDNFPQNATSSWVYNASGNITNLNWSSDDMDSALTTTQLFNLVGGVRVPLTDDRANRFANAVATNPKWNWD